MGVIIRKATPSDAQSLAELHVRIWQIAYVDFFTPEYLADFDVDDREERWLAILSESSSSTLVTENHDRILGFTSLRLNEDDLGEEVGEVNELYVDPDYWNLGVGTALIEAAEAGLAEAGFLRAILWTLGPNDRTRRFYENRGWRFDGTTKPHPTGAELVRYAKDLKTGGSGQPESG